MEKNSTIGYYLLLRKHLASLIMTDRQNFLDKLFTSITYIRFLILL